MARLVSVRIQTVLVLLLFLSSLGVILYNTLSILALPRRELEASNQIHAASKELTTEAASFTGSLPKNQEWNLSEIDAKLRAIADRVLRSYPGVEGGFYLARSDHFSGYAFPTSGHATDSAARNEPPPLEAPVIRRQAQQSLDTGQFLLRTEVVGPSRVVIFTEPVGEQWPANLTTWLMVRLTGPELLEEQLKRTQVSTFLALGGIAVALFLTWNLGRIVKRQGRDQDRLREDLRRAEHLAGLGMLLAGVAHEVRNPLAAVRSTVQLWQRLPDNTRTPESLEAVVQAVDRLNAIVSRLLFFSRADNAERKPLDLNHLLAETMDLLQAQASEQGVHLERILAANLPPVLGSANALRQVALNLLTNSLQAMPQGGRLTCSTVFLAETKQVELRIADSGPGISLENQKHLFEPFFTTRTEGTGLGLALCREIVTNHGGSIEYLTNEQAGASFRVLLSITEDSR